MKTQKVQYGLSGTIISCKRCMAQLYSPDKQAVSTPEGVSNRPIENHKKIGIERWNTRHAPPIGRCGECTNTCNPGDNIMTCGIFERDMMPDDFCSQFVPKGGEENG